MDLILKGCIFEGNIAKDSGGAIYVQSVLGLVSDLVYQDTTTAVPIIAPVAHTNISYNDSCPADENDWDIVCIPGPPGPKGRTGPIGGTGATGHQGQKGPKGEQGATGPPGLKGDTGPPGPSSLKRFKRNSYSEFQNTVWGPPVEYQSIYESNQRVKRSLSFAKCPDYIVCKKYVRRPPGPPGLDGPFGFPSVAGALGSKGEKGDKGKYGPPGLKGDKGAVGPPGIFIP